MKVAYKNDENDPGYGWFVVTDISGPVNGEWEISLENPEDGYSTGKMAAPFLKANKPVFFPVQGENAEENSVMLRVGPAVVDNFNQLLSYRFTLKTPNGVEIGPVTVRIEDVRRSTDEELVQKGDYDVAPPPPAPGQRHSPIFDRGEKAQEPAPEPEPPVLDIVEPDGITEVGLESPEKAEEGREEAAALTVPEDEEEDEGAIGAQSLEMPASKPGGKLWLMIAAIILLLALIGLLIWLYYGPEPDSGAKSAAKQEATIEEQVRSFMGKPDKSGQLAVALADKLKPGNELEQDAIYRLYYFAAQSGDPTGKFKYAEILDPSRPGWGSIEKDGAIAWDMYGQASADNVRDAEAARENLEKWLTEEAGRGNANARAWLEAIRK